MTQTRFDGLAPIQRRSKAPWVTFILLNLVTGRRRRADDTSYFLFEFELGAPIRNKYSIAHKH